MDAKALLRTVATSFASKAGFLSADKSKFADDEAEIVGAYLIELQRIGVQITAENIEQDARNPRSPLHPYFEWDDARAAYQHRLEQARLLIRSIEITVVRPSGKEDRIRAFHAVKDESNGRRKIYVPTKTVFSNDIYAEQIIERARWELKTWMDRYEQYDSLADEVKAVKDILSRSDSKQKSL